MIFHFWHRTENEIRWERFLCQVVTVDSVVDEVAFGFSLTMLYIWSNLDDMQIIFKQDLEIP